MALEYNYIDPDTSNNKLMKMIIKAHYYDILSIEQLQRLTEVVIMSLKRITENTSSINISTYAELLNENMKHIELPIMYISKEVGTMTPVLSWIEPYSYMYKIDNIHEQNIVIMVAVKCGDNVRVTRIKWVK